MIEFIIVVSGDACDDVAALLNSLLPQIDSDPVARVSVADNGCTPATREILAAQSRIRLQAFDDNLGYGGAINRICAESADRAGWLVICNADLVFPPSSVESLVRAVDAAGSEVACVAPLLLDPAESGGGVQPSVGRFPTLARLLLGRLRPRRTRKYRPTPRVASRVDWATGACLALRREAFEAVGGFDESFFLDYEETDLCRRWADRGWQVRFEPAWRVMHRSPNAQRPPDPARQVHTRSSLVRYLARHRPVWESRVMAWLLRTSLAVHPSRHPFAPSWRAGLETHHQLRKRPL